MITHITQVKSKETGTQCSGSIVSKEGEFYTGLQVKRKEPVEKKQLKRTKNC